MLRLICTTDPTDINSSIAAMQWVREKVGVVYSDELTYNGIPSSVAETMYPVHLYSLDRILTPPSPEFTPAVMARRATFIERANAFLKIVDLDKVGRQYVAEGWSLVLLLPTDRALAALQSTSAGMSIGNLARIARFHVIVTRDIDATLSACRGINELDTALESLRDAGEETLESLIIEGIRASRLASSGSGVPLVGGRVRCSELDIIGLFDLRGSPREMAIVSIDRVIMPRAASAVRMLEQQQQQQQQQQFVPLTATNPALQQLMAPSTASDIDQMEVFSQAHANSVQQLIRGKRDVAEQAIDKLSSTLDVRELKRRGMDTKRWTAMHNERTAALMRNLTLDSVDKSSLAEKLDELSDRF